MQPTTQALRQRSRRTTRRRPPASRRASCGARSATRRGCCPPKSPPSRRPRPRRPKVRPAPRLPGVAADSECRLIGTLTAGARTEEGPVAAKPAGGGLWGSLAVAAAAAGRSKQELGPEQLAFSTPPRGLQQHASGVSRRSRQLLRAIAKRWMTNTGVTRRSRRQAERRHSRRRSSASARPPRPPRSTTIHRTCRRLCARCRLPPWRPQHWGPRPQVRHFGRPAICVSGKS